MGEYLAFINDLADQGRDEEARLHVPRERVSGNEGGQIFGRDETGRYELVPDSDGHIWDSDWSMMCVNFPGAVAYARWFSEKTGTSWRLPSELEWEKMARGVDGRLHPWGDHIEAGWASRNDSPGKHPMPEVAGSFHFDRSVYGVFDLGGGLRDWTCSYEETGHDVDNGRIRDHLSGMMLSQARSRVARGPCWGDGIRYDLSTRLVDAQEVHSAFVGFRLIRSLDANN